MRVLVVSHLYPNDLNPILGSFVSDQVQALRAAGVELTVVNPMPWVPPVAKHVSHRYRRLAEYGRATREVDGMRVAPARYAAVPRNTMFWLGGPTLARSLDRLTWPALPSEAFDLVHAHVILPDGYAAVKWGRRHGIPVVCTAHGDDINVNPGFGRLTRAQSTWTIRNADAMIAVSNALLRRMEALAPPRHSRVIPSGIAPAAFGRESRAAARERLGLPPDGLMVLFVGSLLPVKGVQLLIDAFARVRAQVPDATLALVGEGPLEGELRAGVARHGLVDAVRFVGRQGRDLIPTWMTAADLLVLPSVSEGMPLVVLEAMASGLPVVASDVGGISDAVEPPTAGLLVPAGDVVALSATLIEVLHDSALRQRLGAGGRLRAQSFTWEQNAQHVLGLYHELLDEHHDARTVAA